MGEGGSLYACLCDHIVIPLHYISILMQGFRLVFFFPSLHVCIICSVRVDPKGCCGEGFARDLCTSYFLEMMKDRMCRCLFERSHFSESTRRVD